MKNFIKDKDCLLGEEVPGYDGEYYYPKEGDKTEAGFWVSGAGVRIPKTVHIPTGSGYSFVKDFLTLRSGKKIVAWKKWEKIKKERK